MSKVKIKKIKLSKEGYLCEELKKAQIHILCFHRVIMPKELEGELSKKFTHPTIPVVKSPIIFYPKYMEALFKMNKNPFKYAVFNLKHKVAFPLEKMKDWVY